jgi:hypothetical protein
VSPESELEGRWTEYWAPAGAAQTQEYLFFPDGRFGWQAPADSNTPVTLRAGQYRVEDGELILFVHREVGPGAGQSPAEQRMELGDCPPNQEALAIDAGYRCVSVAGRAFWRRAPTNPTDTGLFFPE